MVDNNITNLTKWYTELDFSKQLNIINFTNNNDDDLNELTKEEEDNFKLLIDNIVEIIILELDSDGVVVSKLLSYGLDKISANSLYEFSINIANPKVDALTINKLSPDQLDKTVKFIIKNVVLYRNYKELPFEEFVNACGFSGKIEAKRTLRFITNQIDCVSNRNLNLIILSKKIQKDYGVIKSHAKIITENIAKNNKELLQANMLFKINTLLAKFDNCPIDCK